MAEPPDYAGKRVIVAGAAVPLGLEVTQLLIASGAEVHLVDTRKPDVTGHASFTDCDLHDPAAIAAAVDKIGAYVNALFVCADADGAAFAGAVADKMLPPAEVVTDPGEVRARLLNPTR